MKKEDGGGYSGLSYSQEKLSGKRPYGQSDCVKGLSQIEEQDDERIIQSQDDEGDVIVPTDHNEFGIEQSVGAEV
jgi:hypothetical protein